jgi:hypothetical protein
VPRKDRKGILGVNKNEAFEAGKLRPTMVRSTWGNVKKRIDWSPDSRDKISRDHFNQRVQFPDGVPAITLRGKGIKRIGYCEAHRRARWQRHSYQSVRRSGHGARSEKPLL